MEEKKTNIFAKIGNGIKNWFSNKKKAIKDKVEAFKALPKKEKSHRIIEFFINNSLYIFIFILIIVIQCVNPRFLGVASIVNIFNLSAAKLVMALGIAGCIVLTGTDLSGGRIVGLTACIAASLLQSSGYAAKMFPGLNTMPIVVVIILVALVGGLIGSINGFCTAKFKLHPFIVTLATQLIVYGFLLVYVYLGSNNGQSISGLDNSYTQFIKGTWLKIGKAIVPYYVLYAIIICILMWFIWNKTKLGKNMFAVGANEEAANVSGVNVSLTIIMVFALAGILYSFTGFIEGARIGSNSSATGLNYELDAIAACVIGGVSFVGGIGKIRGVIMGVFLLQIIFVGLNFLSVPSAYQYIIKGLIILIACSLDMRKYLTKK